MKIPYRYAALALMIAAIATPALAETQANVSADSKAPRPGVIERARDLDEIGARFMQERQEMKARFDEAKADIDRKREALRGAFGEARADVKPERPLMKEELAGMREKALLRRDELKAAFKERGEAFREELEGRKAELKASMQERKELMRSRLQEFKDGKKADIAAKVDANLTGINEARVAFFTAAVDRLEAVLTAISSRMDKAAAEGRDVASVRTLVAEAVDAIAAARAGIAVQAGNDYTVTVSSETEVRADVQSSRDALKADLTALRDLVKAAHEAVRAAAEELKGTRPTAEAEVDASATTE